MANSKKAHWEAVYRAKAANEVSWYEAQPAQSLREIRASGVKFAEPIIDVGGGASLLVDELLRAGYRDVTVLDISADVLAQLSTRLARFGSAVHVIRSNVLAFIPKRTYALWHDRAMFHFLVKKQDRMHYRDTLGHALALTGQVVMATFGPEGPEKCSGLPVVRYDAESLSAELGPAFRLLSSSLVTHRTPVGAEQQFLYCRFERGGANP
jgi:hypothetical protein